MIEIYFYLSENLLWIACGCIVVPITDAVFRVVGQSSAAAVVTGDLVVDVAVVEAGAVHGILHSVACGATIRKAFAGVATGPGHLSC